MKSGESKLDKAGITRRDLAALMTAAAVAARPTPAQTTQGTPASPGPILDIAEWSYHWYGVEHATARARHHVQRNADVRRALDSRARCVTRIPWS